jgi:hypothetical protein
MTDFKVGDVVYLIDYTYDGNYTKATIEKFNSAKGGPLFKVSTIISEKVIAIDTKDAKDGHHFNWSINNSDLALATPNDIMFWRWEHDA